ncbi:zeta toxin family protein [Kaistella sp. DKR-2]|uniref:zeta toxin family protein n=1 Tax=Kaistella soli TaxID=2849654 RepID=UPI001C26A78F|nr:zeta toxin family protein [Kaistella soli]MBU8883078.1 zeta toxin family protein [Kaistella soli]
MSGQRLRIFAGPNGSGKTTLFEALAENYDTGIFLNADYIEKELSTTGFIDLNKYGLNLNEDDLQYFLKTERAKSLIAKSINDRHPIDIAIKENIIVDIEKESHSYEGALISAFIRFYLQKQHLDFCFETVMSHPSKIDEIIEAKRNGYKIYLYFICIDDPEVNVSRVENRVEKGGHPVPPDKISSRYYNTLKNLILAIEQADKCYLFDNSGQDFKLIAKINEDAMTLEVEPENLPNWFLEYVLKYYL